MQHTMFVKFTEPIPDAELDQYLADLERAAEGTGVLRTFAARRHVPVPGEEQIPAFVATVVVQLGVADLAALGTVFAAPEVGEVFDAWRARHPFEAAWANHAPLA
ncbi:hypothetical protein Kpho02_32950 [Kitasatospora phosalacinea]|uniref:Uncharacterized protein n=2 Tax=Kitasatospora phosalacinea TaxID=2065 RepID=A0A9W6V0T9_9ACTN|nr:hypothetical protein Kpho02_32950 [Kitasatospora phosalacinea]